MGRPPAACQRLLVVWQLLAKSGGVRPALSSRQPVTAQAGPAPFLGSRPPPQPTSQPAPLARLGVSPDPRHLCPCQRSGAPLLPYTHSPAHIHKCACAPPLYLQSLSTAPDMRSPDGALPEEVVPAHQLDPFPQDLGGELEGAGPAEAGALACIWPRCPLPASTCLCGGRVPTLLLRAALAHAYLPRLPACPSVVEQGSADEPTCLRERSSCRLAAHDSMHDPPA